jgi:holo-[acyl-carrier protein] synthase
MIIGIGSDIVDIRRIEKVLNKYEKKFKERCFSENEIYRSENKFNPASSYAKRYAAKEACAKALGTGLARGIFWKDIAVENNIFGKPYIKLKGAALKKLYEISKKECLIEVSLSDEKNYALANVIIFEKK